ncbi:MAG: hypothetical protein OXD31_06015 [Chloroflexi bacterium]|nr:hypothetical protein [Chloroflexota bacterium]
MPLYNERQCTMMLEMGFQIISCPVGGEPTAITLPYDDAAFIVTEMPYLEVDPDGWHEDLEERIICPGGHTFYVYAY